MPERESGDKTRKTYGKRGAGVNPDSGEGWIFKKLIYFRPAKWLIGGHAARTRMAGGRNNKEKR